MLNALPVILTIRDYALLEDVLHYDTEPFPGAKLLIASKLSKARIVPVPDLPSDTVALHSRIIYRAGAALTKERTLVCGPSEDVPGLTLQIISPRGLALLGARKGQIVKAIRADGSVEDLSLESVSNALARYRQRPKLSVIEGDRQTTALKIPEPRWDDPGDDPGPSAA